ncbi:MAG: alpha/beta fold hydrolase [Gammaproteobacteria bacterium]
MSGTVAPGATGAGGAAGDRRRLPGTPEPTQCWVTPAGLRLCGDAWGPEQGPQVLMIHGGGQNRHAWARSGKALGAAGWRAIALDSRGHGDSDWAPDGDYGQDAFIADLAAVVAALGDRSPVLVGASLGGLNALLAVGEGRVHARALVLVDIAPRTERAGSERVRDFLAAHAAGFESLDAVAEAIAAFRPGSPRKANPQSLARNVREGADGRYYWHWDPRFLDGREHDLATRYERLVPAARGLTIPTLLVRGGSSDVVSREAVDEFLELCPHAEYVDILDAGHMITGDSNERFGQAMGEFLARLD